MIKRYKLDNGQLVQTEAETPLVWLLIDPNEDEKQWVVSSFGLDEHNLASAFDPEEPARMELEPDHLELIFKRPKNYSSRDQFLFKVSSMGLFLFKDKLIIAISEDLNLFTGKYFKHVDGIREIFLKLIYNAIFHFMEHLKIINMIADEIERKINSSMENKYLLNLFTLEKSLVYYLNAANANTYVIERLKHSAEKLAFSPRSVEFLDDIIIENNQCSRQAEIYSNILAGLMDARASIVSNNLNILMKEMNAVVIAVAVPSFFAGVGGMSEFSALAGIDKWYLTYPLFVLVMALIGWLTFVLVRRFEVH